MIIDIHTHIFPEKIVDKAMLGMEKAARAKRYVRGTKDELIASMKKAGIDISVNLPVATNPSQPHKLNLTAIEINKHTEETGILSFGAVHPDDEHWEEELQFISDNGIRGIKLHPMYQKTRFDDIRYMRLIEKAAELDLVVIVHSGEDIGVPGEALLTPKMAIDVVEKTGIKKLILAHMGGWGIWQDVYNYLAGAPVYIDTGFSFGMVNYHPDFPRTDEERMLCDDRLIRDIIKKHGADKVLFGSDSPWDDQKEDIDYLKNLDLTDDELRMILGGNAEILLGLDVK